MKKLLTAMSIILGLGLASAQQTHSATQNTPPLKTLKSAPTQKTTGTVTSTNKEVKLKKDGTPDKRFKQNKKLKKDGTPDRRYKENK